MNIIKRTHSVFNEELELKEKFSLINFPIRSGCEPSKDNKDDIFVDMNFGVSDDGIIQLMNLIPLNILYSDYHNPGSVGKIWKDHHKKFSSFIKKKYYKKILEVGGSSGSLVKNFIDEDKNFSWTIIEPSPNKEKIDPRVNFIEGFFETCDIEKDRFDTIIHSHVFEHVYNPINFLNKIESILDYGDNHYISIPNMRHWLHYGFTNTLFFEHTFYVDEFVLEALLNKSGFVVTEKEIDGHSIFFRAEKSKNIKMKNIDFSYIEKLFDEYVSVIKSDCLLMKNNIGEEQVFLFGAHIFSQIILNLGVSENQIINILDNDPTKHEKRLYGTNLIVKPVEILRGISSPKIILRGGIYTNEIKESILEVNSTAIFL